jgi:6-phosphogluconolactonase
MIQTITSEQAVLAITSNIRTILQEKDLVVLAIPGGRSAKPVFEGLKSVEVDWNKIHIFYVDERKVSKDSDDSNYVQTKKDFLGGLIELEKLPISNVHFCESVSQYDDELLSIGGKFDIALIGIGEDGHYGSIFPRRPELLDSEVTLFMDVTESPKPPSNRITASPNLFLQSTYSYVFFMNEGKQGAYDMFRDEGITECVCPCKQLLRVNNLVVVTNLE